MLLAQPLALAPGEGQEDLLVALLGFFDLATLGAAAGTLREPHALVNDVQVPTVVDEPAIGTDFGVRPDPELDVGLQPRRTRKAARRLGQGGSQPQRGDDGEKTDSVHGRGGFGHIGLNVGVRIAKLQTQSS